ncbi:MAG: flagellar biosynthesis protein FlhF [Lachnospiraceae bacterium]|nr:flagellar biosynthesis protein FlhF [Lachnospiraceae bacterium]
MIIKKFEGKTEEEATALAKKELGSSVVIMNVKKTKKKGLFSFFSRPRVEVTVALEDERERLPFRSMTPLKPVNTAMPPLKQGAGKASEAKKKGESRINVLADENIKPDKLGMPDISDKTEEKSPKEEEKNAVKGDKLLEEKLDSLQSFIEKQLAKEEIDNKDKTDSEQVSYLKLIYNSLIDNEVDEKYANEVINEVGKAGNDNSTIDFVLSNVYQKMILQFGQPKTLIPAKEGAKAVFFIGPTGVGKTTTIAKIASDLSVNKKKKIALLTCDTYRIGAAEQLRTYAGILNAPFRVIYSKDEMEDALKEFGKYDYILVDTAGHSHNNDELKSGMVQFIACVPKEMEKDIFLVLSATTKYRDLLSIVDAYSDFDDYKLIFTKLDETEAYGNLFNIRMYTKADISYVTCGQSVPDDIEAFSPQTTVKQLLGGK